MDKVSVIIVTYNRIDLLKECLYKLKHQNTILDNIYVINNNSSDGTKNYLDNINDNNIVNINLNQNLGGAGGFSYGINYAYENSNSDYFLVMDDDTMVLNNTIYQLLHKANILNDDFGFLCSNVRWWKNGGPSLLNIPVVNKDWNKEASKGLIKINSASFVSLLISRKAIYKVGLPISEMFIWADDVEYTTRISNYMNSYFVSDSIVIHKCANNNDDESIINTKEKRLLYYKCMFRNRLYIYRKYYSYKYFILKLLSYLFYFILIPFESKNHRLKRMIYIISGIWEGLFFNPKIKFPHKYFI